MIAVSVNGLTLRYGMRTIFEELSFALNEDDRLGIVGVNGCGKTSLFRLILGEEEKDSGEIFISKDKTVGALRQDGAFRLPQGLDESASPLDVMIRAFPELLDAEARLEEMKRKLSDTAQTHDEHMYAELAQKYSDLHAEYIRNGGPEFRGRCASVLRRMGFDDKLMSQATVTLSGGQRTRLAISMQLCRDPDILLLDEPTNHLDIETLTWLESYLASYKKCVLVISHDRYFLDRVTNKTLFLENSRGRLFSGSYTRASEQRDDAERVAEKHYREQQKYIRHQEEFIAQQRAWGREKNIKRAESREKLLERVERLELPPEAPRPIHLKFRQQHDSGSEVMKICGLGFGYREAPLFTGLDFLIKSHERVFIIGKNGCGKSTLIKLLTGQLEPTQGYIREGYNVEIGCYDQENRTLSDLNTVKEELWNAYPRLTEQEVRSALAAFRFYADDIDRSVGLLSGGERARLMLAKLIQSKMNLLILDEPTNHLDISSREALEYAVDGFDGTVIAVSHDRFFINRLATRIIELKPGDAFGCEYLDYRVEHPGHGFEEFGAFRSSRAASVASAAAEKAVSEGREQFLSNKKSLSRERSEQRRLERLTHERSELEAELDRVSAELYGEAATDYVRAARLEERKGAIEERLLEIYEEIGV